MATMNISLPEQMRTWIETQIESGLYANNSDYVRDLIRRDQLRAKNLVAMQNAIHYLATDVQLSRPGIGGS